MLTLAESFRVESWSPDLSSSGQSNPEWVRLFWNQYEVSNAANWVEWNVSPVQLTLCESCGLEGCEFGGYDHLSRTAEHVLFFKPIVERDPDGFNSERYKAAKVIKTFGIIAISKPTWNDLQKSAKVCDFKSLPELKPVDLIHLWFQSAPIHLEEYTVEAMSSYFKEYLLVGSTLEKIAAIKLVAKLIDDLLLLDDKVMFELVKTRDTSSLETLYFDAFDYPEWPAFVTESDRVFPALSNEWFIRFRS